MKLVKKSVCWGNKNDSVGHFIIKITNRGGQMGVAAPGVVEITFSVPFEDFSRFFIKVLLVS